MAEKLNLELRKEIIKEWVEEVKRTIKNAQTLKDPFIVDTIPCFLENLAEAIEQRPSRHLATEATNVAEEHGGERARVTDYAPQDVLTEFQLLREITVRRLGQEITIDIDTLRIIQRSFDDAVKESMMAFQLTYYELREMFIHHLTHDLRSPLISANLTMDLILRKLSGVQDEVLRSELVDFSQRVKQNLEYGHELIDSILDNKWVGTQDIVARQKFRPCEIMRILRDAVSGFSEKDRERIELHGTVVQGFWEEKSLRRLATNLISNALAYGFKHSPVTIRVSTILGRALIAFHNEGNPIPVAERGLLFNNLYRTLGAKAANKKGWGLGLGYCRMVVEDHKGSLNIESSGELGTTFTVDIPVDPREVFK